MWKDYLALSRKQQKGFIFLAFLLVLLILYRVGAPLFFASSQITIVKDDSLLIAFAHPEPVNRESSVTVNIPVFNPNEVTNGFLMNIGVKQYVAKNWTHYLDRGGRFKSPAEVGKIYGMDSVLLARLLPSMLIPQEEKRPEKKWFTENDGHESTAMVDLNRPDTALLAELGWTNTMVDSLSSWLPDYWVPRKIAVDRLKGWSHDSLLAFRKQLIPKKRNERKAGLVTLEMNSADTSQWMLLPGIGPVLSKRIVAYRHKLGGFVAADQLMEVYGVSPVLVNDLTPFLQVDSSKVKRININKASLRQLRNHPYIGFYKAQAILEARKSKGVFTRLSELLDLEPFEDASWHKVQPYLSVE